MSEPTGLEAVRAREAVAMPGPWRWAGYDTGSIELRTVGDGGQRIVTSMRSEPCVVELDDGVIALTYQACAECRAEMAKTVDPFDGYRCSKPENLDTIWLHERHASVVFPANRWAVREQHYRGDVARVDHPDAEFIARAREDVPALIAALEAATGEVERLRTLVCALVAEDGPGSVVGFVRDDAAGRLVFVQAHEPWNNPGEPWVPVFCGRGEPTGSAS